MRTPSEKALDITTVKSAHFVADSGVVYDESVGIEFDVRYLDNGRWNVNDDEGRNYKSASLKRALRKAIKANS